MKVPAPSLAPILRSNTQGRILALLIDEPDREFTLTALAELAETSFPTVHREVKRGEEAGILTTRRVGTAKLVRANARSPLFEALRQLIVATFGPPAVIAREFAHLHADAVVLFGSWVARYRGEPGRAPHDVDVLVIGDPARDDVDDAAERAEREIGVPVQVTVRAARDWRDDTDSFIGEIKRRPLLVVLVGDTESALARDLARSESSPDIA